MYSRFARLPFERLTQRVQARCASLAGARLAQVNARSRHALTAAGLACFGVATAYGQGYVQLAGASKQFQDELKRQAAYKAVDDHVQSGMVVGLGTGSTLAFATDRLGEKVKSGQLKDIVVIPASNMTQQHALSLGLSCATLDSHPNLDVTIDGADSVDRFLNLVKGGTQGTHFREKIIAKAAKKFVVVVDESKLCEHTGPQYPISVEVLPFCHKYTTEVIAKLPSLSRCQTRMRKAANGKTFVTDNGNFVIELLCHDPINVNLASRELCETIGVVEHALFVDLADEVIVATANGILVERRAKSWPVRGK
jgi:ribose 5-phosphate isomerase A